MTPAEFRATLAALGWSGRFLSRRLGCQHNLPVRWARGSRPVPASIAAWLERRRSALEADPVPAAWRIRPEP
jgi:hypothetical protein